MFKDRSKVLFASAILGSLYAIYIISYFFSGVASTEGTEQLGASIATALVAPHMALEILALIFNWLAFIMSKKWAAITCGVLYCVAGLAFIPYIMFVIPMIILSFVGLAKLSKLNNISVEG